MINFEGRQQALISAGIIERRAHNVYPHISSSKLKRRCQQAYGIPEPSFSPMPDFYTTIREKLLNMRHRLKNSSRFFYTLIYEMQDKRVGNCFEEAKLAQLIGKINGQKNIFVGIISINKKQINKTENIDHAVTFITNKKIENGKTYTFKNNEAIIIDPWLNIVDYAENYFTKLKNQFKKYFKELPDDDFLKYLIGTDSKNLKDYRKRINNLCQHITFEINPGEDFNLDKSKLKQYRTNFPELVIDKYKTIELPGNIVTN